MDMDMAMDMDMDTVPVDFKFRKTLSLYIKKLPHKWRNGDLIKTIFERENIGVVAQVDILEQEEEDFAITDRVEKMTYSAAIHFQKWNHNSQTISMQVSLCKYKYTWLYYSAFRTNARRTTNARTTNANARTTNANARTTNANARRTTIPLSGMYRFNERNRRRESVGACLYGLLIC